MAEWTPQPSHRRTRYGVVHYGGGCQDDYPNMEVYDATPKGSGLILVLQRPALKALLAAQVRYARRMGWTKARIEKTTVKVGNRRYPEGKTIICLPGTNRSCETQAMLYRRDPNRYASPNTTGHTRGFALDVSGAQGNLAVIYQVLAAEGWKRVRPDDEPWHWAWGYAV
jgi:hypothetical protein